MTRGRSTVSNAWAPPAAREARIRSTVVVLIVVRGTRDHSARPLPIVVRPRDSSFRSLRAPPHVRGRSRGVRDPASRSAARPLTGHLSMESVADPWLTSCDGLACCAHRGGTQMTGRESCSAGLIRKCLAVLLPMAALAGCGGTADTGARNPSGAGPAPVDLGTAGDLAGAAGYVILAKTAVTNVPTSAVTGNIGVSPAAASFLTGFSSTLPAGGAASTSAQVVGKMYAPDYAVPTPANLTAAIGKMQASYTDAAGRTGPDFTELGGGNLGGLTLSPGLYKWSTAVTIPTNVTVAGGTSDVWIFQISGDLSLSAATKVILSGGASARNIFWQVAGRATLGTTSHFEGTILCQTAIALQTGATLNGRALAQTEVALDGNSVTSP